MLETENEEIHYETAVLGNERRELESANEVARVRVGQRRVVPHCDVVGQDVVRDESEKMPQEGEIDLLVDLRQFCLRQDDALAPGHLPDTTYTPAGEEVRYQRV